MKVQTEIKIPGSESPSQQPAGQHGSWKRWLNYQSIVKQLPFFLFLAMLAVVYIYNGHHADKTIRKINRMAKEVKELQWEYKTVKSEVMFRSKQSELVKAVEPLGLKELVESAVVLKGE
jgi:cell division protein FtsL